MGELRKTVLLPLRRRKHGNMVSKSTKIRPDQAELTHYSLCSVGFTSLGRWEDVRWMVSDSGTECAELSRVATVVSQSSASADLKSPDVGFSSGGPHTDIPG